MFLARLSPWDAFASAANVSRATKPLGYICVRNNVPTQMFPR